MSCCGQGWMPSVNSEGKGWGTARGWMPSVKDA